MSCKPIPEKDPEMLFVVFLLVACFLVVAMTSIFQLMPDWLGKPDFIHIIVVFAAYRFGWTAGLVFVFCLGWMLDVVSGIYPGTYLLQSVLVFASIKVLTENSPLKESAYQIPLVGISYFVAQMGFYFFYSLTMSGTLPSWSWNKIVQDTLILLLAAIPSFVLLGYLYDFFSKRKVIHKVISKRNANQFRRN